MAEEKVSPPAPQAATPPPAPDLKVEAPKEGPKPEVTATPPLFEKEPAQVPPKTEEAKPATEEKKPGTESAKPEGEKPVVPEKYDLKLPENSLLEPVHVQQIEALAKEQGLSAEQAQKYLEDRSLAIQQATDAQSSAWRAEAESDPEIGGRAFAENAEFAKRAVEAYGSAKLKEALNKTGTGNHPELLRMLAKVGRAMGEDKAVLPGSQVGKTEKTVEQVFYGDQA